MADKVLVIGLGRFGSSLVEELYKMKFEVAVCDVEERNLEAVDPFVAYGIHGDAKEDSILNELSVSDFDTVVVSIGDSFESAILITKKLKDMGCKQLVCKANDKQRGEILLAVGADRVIYPEEEAGARLAKQIGFKGLVDYLEITSSVSAMELPVPSSFYGKSLAELEFTKRYNLVVAFILRGGKPLLTQFAQTPFEDGDFFFVVGENRSLRKFKTTIS